MNIGDKFIVTSGYNDIGVMTIHMGYVTVGKEYIVHSLDDQTPSLWFRDNVGALISTYSFNIKAC